MQINNTYTIGRDSVVERSHEIIHLTMPDGSEPDFDKLVDEKPPKGCSVRYCGRNYPLVAIQKGLYELVFEVVIDTDTCQELRLGTNMPVDKCNRGEFSNTGIYMVIHEMFVGRRLRTGARVQWRQQEGWYDRARPDQP